MHSTRTWSCVYVAANSKVLPPPVVVGGAVGGANVALCEPRQVARDERRAGVRAVQPPPGEGSCTGGERSPWRPTSVFDSGCQEPCVNVITIKA